MTSTPSIIVAWMILGLVVVAGGATDQKGAASRRAVQPKLLIERELGSGHIVLSWKGKGDLQVATGTGKRFQTVWRATRADKLNRLTLTPREPSLVFRLVGAGTSLQYYSGNAVGYVNLELPPGLSLIANPLYYDDNSVAHWWPEAPDGAQILKYREGQGYEVSTFDGLRKVWSNPDLQVTIGGGFFFRNPSTNTIVVTFVGEVLQGELINPLPEGYSMKGSLVPQAGSINTVHLIPGGPGDEIRVYQNNGQGGGTYQRVTWDETANAWIPDLELQVGQGFWIRKGQATDWVRIFSLINW